MTTERTESGTSVDDILEVAPATQPTTMGDVREALDDLRVRITELQQRTPTRIPKGSPLKGGLRTLKNLGKFVDQFFANDEADLENQENERRAEEVRRNELFAARRTYIDERLVERGPATIGFSGRTKKTQQGEARPTRVCFRSRSADGEAVETHVTIETWEAEALATLVGVPTAWSEVIEVANLADYLSENPHLIHHHLVLENDPEKLPKGTLLKLRVPIAFEKFREQDLVVAAEGSINDPFVAGLMLNRPDARIHRTSTGTLRALRTAFFKAEEGATATTETPQESAKKKRGRPKKLTVAAMKLEDQAILARVAEDPANLRRYFHPVIGADRDMVVFRIAYLEWIQRQALQVAATQRAHQATQKRAFVDQGLLISMLASPGLDTRRGLVDNDLEVLRALEAAAKEEMEYRIKELGAYTRILGNKDAIDRIGPAIGGHLLFEIGNPARFIKALSDEREAAHTLITKLLTETNWEEVWADFWKDLERLRTDDTEDGARTIAELLALRGRRRIVRQQETVRHFTAQLERVRKEDTTGPEQEIAEHYKALDIQDAEEALREARARLERSRAQVQAFIGFACDQSDAGVNGVAVRKHFDKLLEKAREANARVEKGDTKKTHHTRLALFVALGSEDYPAYRKLERALEAVRAARDLKKQSLAKTIGSLLAYGGVKPPRFDAEGRAIPRWQRHICSRASGNAGNNGQLRRAGHLIFDQALKCLNNESSRLGRALRILRERYEARHGTTVIMVTRQGKDDTYEYPMFSGGHRMGSVKWQLFSSLIAWFMKSWFEMRAHPYPAFYEPQPFDAYVEGNRPRAPELVADDENEAETGPTES